jgi:hypothetical protein
MGELKKLLWNTSQIFNKLNTKSFWKSKLPIQSDSKEYQGLIKILLINLMESRPQLICKRNIHKLRNAIFQDFRLPFPLVTKNRTNPYVLTMVRNESLTPPRTLRNLWTSPKWTDWICPEFCDGKYFLNLIDKIKKFCLSSVRKLFNLIWLLLGSFFTDEKTHSVYSFQKLFIYPKKKY